MESIFTISTFVLFYFIVFEDKKLQTRFVHGSFIEPLCDTNVDHFEHVRRDLVNFLVLRGRDLRSEQLFPRISGVSDCMCEGSTSRLVPSTVAADMAYVISGGISPHIDLVKKAVTK